MFPSDNLATFSGVKLSKDITLLSMLIKLKFLLVLIFQVNSIKLITLCTIITYCANFIDAKLI